MYGPNFCHIIFSSYVPKKKSGKGTLCFAFGYFSIKMLPFTKKNMSNPNIVKFHLRATQQFSFLALGARDYKLDRLWSQKELLKIGVVFINNVCLQRVAVSSRQLVLTSLLHSQIPIPAFTMLYCDYMVTTTI